MSGRKGRRALPNKEDRQSLWQRSCARQRSASASCRFKRLQPQIENLLRPQTGSANLWRLGFKGPWLNNAGPESFL